MTLLQTKIISDTWIEASWQDFIQATENPDYEKGKFYYYQGKLRIEMFLDCSGSNLFNFCL
jgi:hypothetical protein